MEQASTMRYSAKAVANYFLEKAWAEGKQLDQLQVQKLVFFAHGWYLGNTDQGLVGENVEAWRHGPVFRSLFQEFTSFGRQPINRWASEIDFRIGRVAPAFVDKRNAALTSFLDKVWEANKNYTGLQLSDMTHAPGSPWHKVRSMPGTTGTPVIPEQVIAEYFRGLLRHNDRPATA